MLFSYILIPAFHALSNGFTLAGYLRFLQALIHPARHQVNLSLSSICNDFTKDIQIVKGKGEVFISFFTLSRLCFYRSNSPKKFSLLCSRLISVCSCLMRLRAA